MSENVLKVENATMQFGGVIAVDNMLVRIYEKLHQETDWVHVLPDFHIRGQALAVKGIVGLGPDRLGLKNEIA